jgi:hypothetical protein
MIDSEVSEGFRGGFLYGFALATMAGAPVAGGEGGCGGCVENTDDS